ncbi:MAG TPA: nickel pincer cofactor biosynthesis protein LarC [Gemmatimonadales bacterium]|nr:nickel pincer cofactor biosynthesis protein LarC [Gemmatimonadales bacterium]
MPQSRFAILDPAAGISGDMLLGALVAAGAPEAWLTGLPARLGCPEVSVGITQVERCGVHAVKATVRLPGGEVEAPAAPHRPTRSHSHPHPHKSKPAANHAHGPHRHVGELLALIERAPLSTWVKERAGAAFRLLAEAEGRVHGVPAESVALHEVGALDALIDIVGGVEGFEQLGVRDVYHRAVAVGEGWVHAAHGIIPVPAPATAVLLEGLEVAPNGPVSGEATTPTGAALLRALSSGPPPARWRAVSAANWGAGGRDPAEYPNALRLILAEPAHELGEVVVLSTDLDDLSPEYLDPLREALVAAGALDVQTWPTQMKKGRTGFRVEAVVAPADVDRAAEAFFRHSTTAGVRRTGAERVTLPRREVRLDVAGGGSVRVKLLDGPDGLRAKPEYDDVAAAARRAGRPVHELARELQTRALTLAGADRPAATARDTTTKEP